MNRLVTGGSSRLGSLTTVGSLGNILWGHALHVMIGLGFTLSQILQGFGF